MSRLRVLESGWEFQQLSTVEFVAQVMIDLLTDETLRGKSIGKVVVDFAACTWDAMAPKVMEIYEELVH